MAYLTSQVEITRDVSIQPSGLTTQDLAVPSRKRFLKLIVNFFYISPGFDNGGKGMLIGYARVSSFIPANR